jgi:Cu/Zn superoxide dismutase
MKHLGLSLIALNVVLAISALPCAAKTKVDLKDSQGKDVGTITLSAKGSGVALKLQLHDLPFGEHAIHFHQNPTSEPKVRCSGFQVGRPAFQSRQQKAWAGKS